MKGTYSGTSILLPVIGKRAGGSVEPSAPTQRKIAVPLKELPSELICTAHCVVHVPKRDESDRPVRALLGQHARLYSYRRLIADPSLARLHGNEDFARLLRAAYQVWQQQLANNGRLISPPPETLPPPEKVLGR